MLYHVSQQSGLKILKPSVSTHKNAYVYAIENLTTGLLFGAKMDDFDFVLSTDENEVPALFECYPNALQNVYQGKSCSVYVVNDINFKRGMTSWSPELVCEQAVEVVEEIIIEDLYARLLEEEQQGNLEIIQYEFSDEYRHKIASHIIDRIIRFEINLNTCMQKDIRFATYYRKLVEALTEVMDGHLLQ